MSSELQNSKSWSDPSSGEFKRQKSSFREFISKSHPIYKPEPKRYHLYISLACPWASRVSCARSLLGLTNVISMSIVHWYMETSSEPNAANSSAIKGWRFLPVDDHSTFTAAGNGDKNNRYGVVSDLTQYLGGDISNCTHSFANCDNHGNRYDFDGTIDHINGFEHLRDLYYFSNPNYDGRFTVPILYDIKTNTIVNNESSEILRMLSDPEGLLQFSDKEKQYLTTLYPENDRKNIDYWNDKIYETINNGVYKTGFAEQLQAYEKNLYILFETLDEVEEHFKQKYSKDDLLDNNKTLYFVGDQITEADIRLFVTVVRFDAVYHQHFKCNLKMIRSDYPYINNWLIKLYNHPETDAFKDTTNFAHIKLHYTRSHKRINPLGITPVGPSPNLLSLKK